MTKKYLFLLCLLCWISYSHAQEKRFNFRIRTITAGVTLKSLSDTGTLKKAISFLIAARITFTDAGYEVQTLRIATSNLYSYTGSPGLEQSLPALQRIDRIMGENNIALSVGQILPPGVYQPGIGEWAAKLVTQTKSTSFNLSISSHALKIHDRSIKASAEIIRALAGIEGGEANFRFTAMANCPPNIPFFPAAYHEGVNSFAIGLESPNLLREAFIHTGGNDTGGSLKIGANYAGRNDARDFLKIHLEKNLQPVEKLAESIAWSANWKYDGIDASPAPGLDASIGLAIETYTKQPFGSASTLGACALITDVLKSLDIKKCGYSGLMLPVVEDTVLARRAAEDRYTVQELLLYSAVSGTGLDVVPIAGDTPAEIIEAILRDVAALSLKYTTKALSVRLFPIPEKKAGEKVSFSNPYLTPSVVMKLD
ncbi:DUF711 family protein [Flavihumibacter sediminis]|nr:DUF711 family protein [Flavihumibacter sediminis]